MEIKPAGQAMTLMALPLGWRWGWPGFPRCPFVAAELEANPPPLHQPGPLCSRAACLLALFSLPVSITDLPVEPHSQLGSPLLPLAFLWLLLFIFFFSTNPYLPSF